MNGKFITIGEKVSKCCAESALMKGKGNDVK